MARKKTNKSENYRKTALCYIRQSFTRDGDDTNSPERQRANIEAVCERNGWLPEWYEDVGGHKSGRSEKNRPQWLALKERLGDPDVIALIANDLSRLHRKGWRVGDLIEYLNENDVNLVLAAPGREVDTTTMKGRMFLQFGAIVDEYYAEDISQRAKDNIIYRKARGQTIGMPPFGTVRGDDGFLKPTDEGAWLLSDGSYIAGKLDEKPDEGASWRGYYDAAHFILSHYATGNLGLIKIAYMFNDAGWLFRDRTGQPRPVTRDDVRRVVANWAEYGGIVDERKAKARPAYEDLDLSTIPFNAERAVFEIDLLRTIAQIRQARSVKPSDQSVKARAFPYPLSGIVFCAHCDQLAREHNNPKLRTAFSGNTNKDGTRRYRHKLGVKCGSTNKSVTCDILENEFRRLIDLLSIRPEALDLLTELAIQADKGNGTRKSEDEMEKEKLEAIALCNRRIDAAVHLYKDGVIDREEYLRTREANEREIAHWEARTTETEKLAVELGMCMEALDRIIRLWDISDEEDKQGLARSLFTSVSYDLDRQQIVEFKLKPWADRYLILRHALYEVEDEAKKTTKSETPSLQDLRNHVPHRGLEPLF